MKDYLIFVLRNRTLFYFSNTIHVIHCSKSAHIVRFYIVIQSIPFVPAFRLMYSNNFLCKGLRQEPNYVPKPDISKTWTPHPPPPTKKFILTTSYLQRFYINPVPNWSFLEWLSFFFFIITSSECNIIILRYYFKYDIK